MRFFRNYLGTYYLHKFNDTVQTLSIIEVKDFLNFAVTTHLPHLINSCYKLKKNIYISNLHQISNNRSEISLPDWLENVGVYFECILVDALKLEIETEQDRIVRIDDVK